MTPEDEKRTGNKTKHKDRHLRFEPDVDILEGRSFRSFCGLCQILCTFTTSSSLARAGHVSQLVDAGCGGCTLRLEIL